MTPLSKCYDPADFPDLAAERVIVDRHFHEASEQAEMRRWEYALALRAAQQWRDDTQPTRRDPPFLTVDVGGAGSPFGYMATQVIGTPTVIDPSVNETLATALQRRPRLQDVVFCLSVIEHVPDMEAFLYHLACLVAPGGLLVLTVDCTDQPSTPTGFPVDDRHFHWMRERIFNPQSLEGICNVLQTYSLSTFGGVDWTYQTDIAGWGYSAASLVLTKRA